MKREHLVFLAGGFAFGILVGWGVFNAFERMPGLETEAGPAPMAMGPQGTPAPTQVGPSGNAGAAPMMQEINALKARLQDAPDDFPTLVRLGGIYFDAAMWDQAAGYYERAVEQRPDDPDLLTDLGTCYRGQQKFDKAIDMFRQAGELDPGHWQSRFNFAVVAGIDLGQYDIAMAMVEALEAMQPPPRRVGELRKVLEQARAAAEGGGASS